MAAKLRIGVLVCPDVQLFDLSTIDLLGCMSINYLQQMPFLSDEFKALTPTIEFVYVAPFAQGTASTPAPELSLTCNITLKATYTYDSLEVAPGTFDAIVVPGPSPDIKLESGALKWLKSQSEAQGTDILSVCTGLYVCAQAGIADGKSVSGPRGAQADLKAKYQSLKLVGNEYRWVKDGNLWSSGGITNGNDLMIAYARGSGHFPAEVVDFSIGWCDVVDRGQLYEGPKAI